MDAQRYQTVKRILLQALELPTSARVDFVQTACGADAELRAEVESLLAHEAPDDYLNPLFAADGSVDHVDEAPRTGRFSVLVTIEHEGHPTVELTFDHTPITIGGSPDNDVVLGSPHVSRRHATVVVSAGGVIYRDTSRNGSFVLDQRIRDARLESADVVVIPPFRLSFVLETGGDQATQMAQSPLSRPDDAARLNTTVVESLTQVVLPGFRPPAAESSAGATVATKRIDGRTFHLVLVRAPDNLKGRIFTFDRTFREGDLITVGRSTDAEVCLNIQSVSRRHAVFTLTAGGRWHISDLGSPNGIRVNGTKVDATLLVEGDEIAFGPDITALFRLGHDSNALA